MAVSKTYFQAQRADEKNGALCLVMFIPMVMVIEMSKMADKLVAVRAKYSSEPEKSS